PRLHDRGAGRARRGARPRLRAARAARRRRRAAAARASQRGAPRPGPLGRLLTVRGTKTAESHRQVPLTGRALAARGGLPARLQTPLLFTAPEGGPIALDNFRKRVWSPAVEAAGIATPARMYDPALDVRVERVQAGVTVFELAKVMGTSVRMIERHYGALLGGAHAGIAARLDA